MNFYNEHDPKAAAWLRELIKQGLIPNGHVDERSITDLSPKDCLGFTQCHFFAGIGGWSLALDLAGFEGPCWTGSCPCQPFSNAGEGKGQEDARHLWPAFFRLIRECRPNVIVGEQVENAIGHGWLDGVQADLEGESYAVGHCVLGAHSVGAPHIRQRLYWVAESTGQQPYGRRDARGGRGEFADNSSADGLANAKHDGGRSDEPGRGSQGRDADRRACGGLVLPDSAGRITRQSSSAPAGYGGATEPASGVDGLGDAARWEQRGPRESSQVERRELPTGGSSAWVSVVHSSDCDDDGNCPVCGTDFSDCGCPGPTQDGYEYRDGPDGLQARWVGDTEQPGLEERSDERRILSGAISALPGKVPECGSYDNAWSDFTVIPCADGKARRVGAGVRVLAHGIPGRVGLLRGYGNAIVPAVAAEFVKAFAETLH